MRGSHLLPSQLPGEHTGHEAASRHIIAPLALTAGTHLPYPQWDGGLSQPCSTDTGFPRQSPIQVLTRVMAT